MRHFFTAFTLAIAISGVAQSTQAPAQGNAPAAKRWLNPALTYGSVTDIDGNTYATIQIGTQVWMAENLRTTRYRNGDPILHVTDDDAWSLSTTGAWCHYDHHPEWEVPYGKLYNWYAVVDPRNACPAGWHMPTDAEWTVLTDYLDAGEAFDKMTSTGIEYWEYAYTDDMDTDDRESSTDDCEDCPTADMAPANLRSVATNESGFSGLPGGYRFDGDGLFGYLGYLGYWWSASESGAELAWFRYLGNDGAVIYRNNNGKRNGFSVRCLRD